MAPQTRSRPVAFWLALAIPLLSIASGAVMLYLAQGGDASVPLATQRADEPSPLSKTSWRGGETP